MSNLKLLDCTLRDGGYINDWNFGKENIIWIFEKLQRAKIDIIELGYLRSNITYNPDKALFASTSNIDELFLKTNKKAKVSAMIDFGACDLFDIKNKKDSFLDILRLTFRKHNIKEAFEYAKELIKKGYEVFLQPVSITSYSEEEMLDLIKKINILKPEALSIVDSYGLMHEEGVIRYFDLMNDNLLDEIGIAYHSHNNFQLAYSNSIKLMNSKTKRKLYFDGSLYGMGKSAGNCNIELLAMYANNNFSKKYDLNEILDIIDVQILKIFDKFKWGYQLPFFISASNNCHPNYVNYLLNKNMLTIKEINQIVNNIQQEKRLIFDETHCEEQYQKYQNIKIDDLNTCTQLKEEFSKKPLLLIAPGKSIIDENNTIKNFIQKKPLIISINHINKYFDSEYVFFSNAKRFEQFEVQIKKKQNLKTITTSNISDESKISKYIINRNELSNKKHITSGSSLCLFLEFLIKIGIKTVYLAGFDGFDENQNHYYYDNDFDFYKHFKNPIETTQLIASELKTLKKEINIEFLTKSQYMKYLE